MGRGTDKGVAKGTVKTAIEPTSDTAEYDFLEIIAEQEDKEMEELPSLYEELDHLIESLFRDPPSPEAQVEITFSYAGYRITIDQQGDVTLVPVKETIEDDG